MNTPTIRLILATAFGIAVATAAPALAQSTLGGAKPQQNKIGGVAKPAPVVGGAVIHTPTPPKPATVEHGEADVARRGHAEHDVQRGTG